MKAATRKRLKKKITSRVLDVFLSERNRVMNYKQVASRLNESDNQVKLLITEALKELESGGKLLLVEKGKYRLADMSTAGVEGVIELNRRGKIFFNNDDLPEAITVAQKKSINVLRGDVVMATIKKDGKKEVAIIKELLNRNEKFYSGIIDVSVNYAFLHPDDPFMQVDLFIPKDKLNGAKNGEKVAARIMDWPETADSPFGEVIEVLGEPGTSDAEMESLLYEFGLPNNFPQKVQDDVDRIPLTMSKNDLKGRTDLRKTTTFTIDPEDAKDFDDAISFESLSDGSWKIGVHIADVAHYIKEGGALDEEAIKRATSIYLADRVIPMLPEVLSNVLCSLRPKEDKLSFSVLFTMNKDAVVTDYEICKSIIHSDHRFTYEEAQEVIETGKGPYSEEMKVLHGLSLILRKKRMKSGSFDFHSEEIRFRYDESGMPVEVVQKTLKDSNKLVEEFMLLANQKVAEHIATYKPIPAFIYRNHDLPNVEKLMALAEFAKSLGYSFDPGSRDVRDEIKNLMAQTEGKEDAALIAQMVIRTMAKADYGAKNIGHYGLGFENYSHFTSPIRRYPDVIAHRLLWKYLNGQKGMKVSAVDVLAKHCSLRERKAVEAERASIKYMQAVYLRNHIGKKFKGKVSGLTSFGIFVILEENFCEGLVPLRSMDDDMYVHRTEENIIVGTKHGDVYRMGDEVEVKVISSDPVSRQIDLHFI